MIVACDMMSTHHSKLQAAQTVAVVGVLQEHLVNVFKKYNPDNQSIAAYLTEGDTSTDSPLASTSE